MRMWRGESSARGMIPFCCYLLSVTLKCLVYVSEMIQGPIVNIVPIDHGQKKHSSCFPKVNTNSCQREKKNNNYISRGKVKEWKRWKDGGRGREGEMFCQLVNAINLIYKTDEHSHAGSILRDTVLASTWREEKARRQTCHRPPGSTHVNSLRCSQAQEAFPGQISFQPGINKIRSNWREGWGPLSLLLTFR